MAAFPERFASVGVKATTAQIQRQSCFRDIHARLLLMKMQRQREAFGFSWAPISKAFLKNVALATDRVELPTQFGELKSEATELAARSRATRLPARSEDLLPGPVPILRKIPMSQAGRVPRQGLPPPFQPSGALRPLPTQLANCAKTRLASSRFSLLPTSNHVPGTLHAWTGVLGYSHWTKRPGWSGLLPSAMYCWMSGTMCFG